MVLCPLVFQLFESMAKGKESMAKERSRWRRRGIRGEGEESMAKERSRWRRRGIDGEGKESMAKERNLSACKAFRVFHCVLHSLAVFEIDVVRRLKSSMACNLGKYQGQSDFREMM